jgi:N-methylhydantoinase B
MAIDTLDLEVFRSVTRAVLDEIEVNITRTAYSIIIYEIKDYTVGMLSGDFEMMTQSQQSLPIFLCDMGSVIKDAVEIIGVDNLAPGDVLLSNYAAVQGHHINNVVSAAPVFADGEIIAYIAARVHWTDLGGMAPGSMSWHARDIFQEGTQYRGLRVIRGGKIVPEVLATILANTRLEKDVRGDLMAQLGACVLGCRRWQERIAPKWDPASIKELWQFQRAQSAEIARSRIRDLPYGNYEAQCRIDDAGEPGTDPLLLKVKVKIEGEKMVIDFMDLPPQVPMPINCGVNAAIGVARMAYKFLIAPDYPADEGFFEPLEVKTVEGTVMTARKGAPMSHWHVPATVMPELILRAIGERHPELVPAGTHNTLAITVFSGVDEDGDRWFVAGLTAGGGWGGSIYADGFSELKTMGHGDSHNFPAEILEARSPITMLRCSFIPNSAGRGTHRGGWGVERIYQVAQDVLLVDTLMDRTLDPPWGLAGGEAGRPGNIEIRRPGDEHWSSAKKVAMVKLPKGSLVRVRTSGGGGWGPPEKRDEAAEAKDRIGGLIDGAESLSTEPPKD